MAHSWLARWWSNKDTDESWSCVWEFAESNEDVVSKSTVFPNPSCQVLNVTTHIPRLTKSSFLNLAPFQPFSRTRSVLVFIIWWNRTSKCTTLSGIMASTQSQKVLPDVDFKFGVSWTCYAKKQDSNMEGLLQSFGSQERLCSCVVWLKANQLKGNDPSLLIENRWKWWPEPAQTVLNWNPTT